MGNWNRRYMPRKKQRHYDYEDLPPSPPTSYSSSGPAGNRVPSWEIDYCLSLKVPWKKVLASKHYIHSYPTVLDWDGSAGKEALENAKKRYWAKINGLLCDNPLPDPDMYIDEIDWNPYIDPELMADLELQAFDPDDSEKVERLETINEEVGDRKQHDRNRYASDNPWERHNVLGNGNIKENIKEEKGWGGWNDTLKIDDPWEQSLRKLDGSSKDKAWRSGNESSLQKLDGSSKDKAWRSGNESSLQKLDGSSKDNAWRSGNESCHQKLDGSSKDNAWRSGNESSGWPQAIDNTRSSSFVGHGCQQSWNCNGKTAAVKQSGWGQGQRGNDSWSSNPWNKNAEGMTSFRNNNFIGSKERGWRDDRNASWGVTNAEYQGNEAKNWDPNFRGGRSFRDGGRKRESTVQHSSKYKSSRYLGDSYQYGHQY